MTKVEQEMFFQALRRELSAHLPKSCHHLLNRSLEIRDLYANAPVHPDLTRRHIAIIRQFRDIDKKFIGTRDPIEKGQSSSRDEACFQKFLEANEICRVQNEKFHELDQTVMDTLELARVEIDRVFWKCVEKDDSPLVLTSSVRGESVAERQYDFDHEESVLVPVGGFSSGPGSCTGVRGTSIFQKYRKTWYVTTERGKLILQFLRKFHKPLRDLSRFEVNVGLRVKPSFVPKTSEISRLIAPQLNGDLYLQYPAESFLRSMLLTWGIDLETQQDLNREMARNGSLFDNLDMWDFSMKVRAFRPCTLDLVSASDIVGVRLTQYVLPIPLFNYLNMCRSKFLETSKQLHQCQMMATMGNAYCFPLQTLIFAAIIRAVYYRLGIPLSVRGKPTYSVYGDDIIVDVAAYDTVVKTLRALHMVPNLKKSYASTLFRESCGADYYDGYDIRPVSTEYLQDDCDAFSLANRLLGWSFNHSVDLSKSIAYLLSTVTMPLIVPLSEGTDAGFQTPTGAIKYVPKNWRAYIVNSCSSVLWHSPWPYLWASATTMTSVTYHFLEREPDSAEFELPRWWMSLFPFLRGGVVFTDVERTIELPQNSTSISRKARIIPNWYDGNADACQYEVTYYENILANLSIVHARVWQEYQNLVVVSTL